MGMTLMKPWNMIGQVFSFLSEKNAGSAGANHLDNLLERYLRFHRVAESTESTLIHKDKEIGIFLRFLKERGHAMDAADLTTDDVSMHMTDMSARGLALETRRTRRRALHAWCAWMVDNDIITTNPVTRVKLRKGPKRHKEFITKDQFQELLNHCASHTLTDTRRTGVLWILATTGMRRRELWLLNLRDLDWDNHRITITNGKGGKTRSVPFSPVAQDAVKRYLDLRQGPRRAATLDHREGPPNWLPRARA